MANFDNPRYKALAEKASMDFVSLVKLKDTKQQKRVELGDLGEVIACLSLMTYFGCDHAMLYPKNLGLGLTHLSHRKAHDMAVGSQRAERKSLSAPDETRNFPKGKLEIVTVGGTSLGRATFEPGWKWSECVKPIAKTDSCQAPHLGYVISGRMKVVMDNGEELDFGPGDAMSAPPGHDAWIVGDDKCVVIDFVGYQDYAKPK